MNILHKKLDNTRQVYQGGETMQGTEPGGNIVAETDSTIGRQAVSLREGPDAGNLQVRF
jgi:hypothetical protein